MSLMLVDIRGNSVSEFKIYFKNTSNKKTLVNKEKKIPLLCERQMTRFNIEINSSIEWYRL